MYGSCLIFFHPVQNGLKSVLHTLTQQSEQLRLVMHTQAATGLSTLTPSRQVVALQEALNKVSILYESDKP